MRPNSLRKQYQQSVQTVVLTRGRSGYGFTISGQQPCRLGGIVQGSSADGAGLQVGDQVMSIDGHDVSNSTHDDVVSRIGLSRGTLTLKIAERCSDYSSDEDLDSSDGDFELTKNAISKRVKPPVQECGVLRGPSSTLQKTGSSSKYSQYQGRSGAIIEHIFGPPPETVDDCSSSGYRTRVIDSHRFDRHNFGSKLVDSDVDHRHIKHTVITRQDRLGWNKVKRTEELRHHQSSPEDDDYDCMDESTMNCDALLVVVSYSGSVEMPSDAPRLAGSRLQSIRAAVQRIRATRNTRSLVLMDIDADGIRLRDTSRCNVANYITECIAFCGICPDDRRFFGIFMTPAGKENDLRATSSSSCHVFMVEPELSEHRMHASTAARFGINCTMDLDTDCCLEFPKSATPIIAFLGRLYRQRKSVNGFFAPIAGVLNETKSNNVCNGAVENSKACVVDLANPRRGVTSIDQSFIHNLSIIQPTAFDGDDKEDSLEYFEDHCFNEPRYKISGHMMSSTATTGVPSTRDRLNAKTAQADPIGPTSSRTSLNDVNSADNLRRNLRKFMSADYHQQPSLKPMPYNENGLNRYVKKSVKKGPVSSPALPPPPIPPRQVLSRSDSECSSVSSGNPRTQSVQSVLKLTPVMANKNVTVDSRIGLSQACSSSKPPLPERRPTISKPVQKSSAPVHKREAVERPKSTPPINLKSDFPMPMTTESTNYDSDPGELVQICQSSSKLEHESTSEGTSSVISSVGISAVSCKTLTTVGTDKSSVGRAASWAIHFDRLMSDSEGVETFSEFLQKEFSRENLAFWLKCEEYKSMLSADQRKLLGAEIVDRHFKDSCCEPVNIDGVVRDAVMQNMASAVPDLFEAAHKQIYLLMKQDCYPRFLKSEIYKQAVIAEMEGKPFPCASKQSSKPSSKLMKKSKSAADDVSEEKRRKSLLPWNRNKTDKKLAKLTAISDQQNKMLNMVINSGEQATVDLSNALQNKDETEFRVMLPDNNVRTVFGCPGQTMRDMLSPLTDKLPVSLDFYDIIVTGSEKSISLNAEATHVVAKEISLELCSLFRLDLPGHRQTMAIRARSYKRLHDVVDPILLRHGVAVKDVIIHINDRLKDETEFRVMLPDNNVRTIFGCPGQTMLDILSPLTDKLPVSLDFYDIIVTGSEKIGTGVILGEDATVSFVDGKHILVQSLDEVKGKKKKDGLGAVASGKHSSTMSRQKSSTSLSESVTISQQLKSLFNGHADTKMNFNDVRFDELGAWIPDKITEVKMKSDEGRHSGLFSFMRRSSLGDKGKGSISAHQTLSSASSMISITPSTQSHHQNPDQNPDENTLFDLLKRIQNRQYDDQRGTSLTAFKEMPEFLRISNDAQVREKSISERVAHENETLHQSEIEVRRGVVSNGDENFSNEDFQLSPTPAGVLHATCPFDDESDSVMPSYEIAENYFSNSVRVSSPDFNDSRLMECSLRDIGMDSPGRSMLCDPRQRGGGATGWSLFGNIADIQPHAGDDKTDANVFVVPSAPPPISRHHIKSFAQLDESSTLHLNSKSNNVHDSADNVVLNDHGSETIRIRPCKLDVRSEPQTVDSSVSTPSPTTHDLVFVNGECIVSKAVPFADEDLEDGDELFGVV